jgi:hypothetical protein
MYKKLINKALLAEKEYFDRERETGPYTQLIDEWNSEFFPATRQDNPEMRQNVADDGDAPDIEAALAQAEAYRMH